MLSALLSAVLLAAALVGAVAIGFAAQAWWRHPDLDPWHTLRLVNEFKAGRDAPRTLTEYMAQEERLFAELREAIYAAHPRGDTSELERYGNSSLAARIALGDADARAAWDAMEPSMIFAADDDDRAAAHAAEEE